jgi:hypothetical protein
VNPGRSLLSLAGPALALGATLAAAPALANPLCPESQWSLAGSPIGTTHQATLDTMINSFGVKHVSFDLTAGTVELDQCCSLLHTMVDACDAYDVAGVTPGTPVSLTAMLSVDGSVSTTGCGGSGCGGVFYDRIQSGAVLDDRTHAIGVFNGSVPFHDDLSIPVTIVAGTPVEIHYHFEGYRSPGGSHMSQGVGTIGFAGLPPGARVTSCQGFGAVTPVLPSSWGQLKVRYR